MNSNSKTFGIFALSLLILAVMVSGVSAFSINPSSNTLTFTQSGEVQGLNLTSSGGGDLYNISTLITSNSGASFSITPKTANNVSKSIFNVSLTGTSGTFYYGDSASGTLLLTAQNISGNYSNATVNLKYVKSFCRYGEVGADNISMDIIGIKNDGSGSDQQWYPLDTIEIKVRVYNHDTHNDANDILQLGLFRENSDSNIAGDLRWLQDSDQVSINVPSDSSEVYTFTFQVNPDIDTSKNYRLMLKAYSDDVGEKKICTGFPEGISDYGGSSYYASINIKKESSSSKAVVVDTSALPDVTTAQCGQQVTLSPMIYNIGSQDYKSQILVKLYNSELGLNLNQTLPGNLNSGDGVQAPFTFTIPRNATEATSKISFTTYYGYNTNNNGYNLGGSYYTYASDNTFNTLLTVKGNCVYATPATTQVQASLQSGGKAGEPLVIQAAITNTGSKTVSYSFGLEGYNSWATLSGINPSNITLAPGQSQNVALNMNINKDATGGNKQFTLDVYSNGYLITQQPLSLSVTQTLWNSITGNVVGSGSNIIPWIFGILIIAVLAILVVVLVRRRK